MNAYYFLNQKDHTVLQNIHYNSSPNDLYHKSNSTRSNKLKSTWCRFLKAWNVIEQTSESKFYFALVLFDVRNEHTGEALLAVTLFR